MTDSPTKWSTPDSDFDEGNNLVSDGGTSDNLNVLEQSLKVLAVGAESPDIKLGDLVVVVTSEESGDRSDFYKHTDASAINFHEGELEVCAVGTPVMVPPRKGSGHNVVQLLVYRPPLPLKHPSVEQATLAFGQIDDRAIRDSLFGIPLVTSAVHRLLHEAASVAFMNFLTWVRVRIHDKDKPAPGAAEIFSECGFRATRPVLFLTSNYRSPRARLTNFLETYAEEVYKTRPDEHVYTSVICHVPARTSFLTSDESLPFESVEVKLENVWDFIPQVCASTDLFETLGKMPPGSSTICLSAAVPRASSMFVDFVPNFESLVDLANDGFESKLAQATWRSSDGILGSLGTFRVAGPREGRYLLDWEAPRYLHVLKSESDDPATQLLDLVKVLTLFCNWSNRSSHFRDPLPCSEDELESSARLFLVPDLEGDHRSDLEALNQAAKARVLLSRQSLRIVGQLDQVQDFRSNAGDLDRTLEHLEDDDPRDWFLTPINNAEEDLGRVARDLETIILNGSANYDLLGTKAAVATPAAQEGFNRRVALIGSAFLAPGLVAAVFGSTKFSVPVSTGAKGFVGLLLVMSASAFITGSIVGLLELSEADLPTFAKKMLRGLRFGWFRSLVDTHRLVMLLSTLLASAAIMALGLSYLGVWNMFGR